MQQTKSFQNFTDLNGGWKWGAIRRMHHQVIEAIQPAGNRKHSEGKQNKWVCPKNIFLTLFLSPFFGISNI